MRFAYYDRLSKKDKLVYDASDALARVEVPDLVAARAATKALEAALASEDRKAIARASSELVRALCDALGVERAQVRVLAGRPRSESAELHGLYVREEGKVAVLRVWMKTAAFKRVVRFRTFLRTLIHELLHHLDFVHFGLPDTFHTEGFYRRESNLVTELAGPPARRRPRPRRPEQPEPSTEQSASGQLELGLAFAGRTPSDARRTP